MQDLECVLSIEDCVGYKLKNREKIIKAAMLMYQCQDGSGDMPNYGSNDGALIFPMTSCGYRDFRPVINTVYALSTGKELYRDGKHQEELIWFNVQNAVKEYVERTSSQFSEAGLFTFRNKESWAMLVLNDFQSRPAQLDQFHFDLWIDGINVFCDAGSFSYASDIGKDLIKTASHNTIKIDGKEQMQQHGPFLIYDWTKRKIKRADGNAFEGVVNSSYKHERKVEYSDGKYLLIDKADGDFQVIFHTPCDVEIIGKKVILSYKGKKVCELISNGLVQIKKSIRSLYYLRKEEINCISIKGKKNHAIITTIKVNGDSEL